MKTYSLVKTINGHSNGQVIDTYNNLDDARAALIVEMSYIDKGG